jgi:hypothetical protein
MRIAIQSETKQSNLYIGLERPLGLQKYEAPIISIQSAHKRGKVFNPMYRPPLPPTRFHWYSHF